MRRFKATVMFEFVAPYSQSRAINEPKLQGETADLYEQRTWRMRMHTDDGGNVFIPPNAIKNGLAEAAKYLSKSIKGKGKNTYTKHFEAGVLVLDPVRLPVRAADAPGEWLFVPADGRRGGPKRVMKCFGRLENLGELMATIYVLDPVIDEETFKEHLDTFAGFIGLGRFRPRNNGWYGRLKILDVKWEEEST